MKEGEETMPVTRVLLVEDNPSDVFIVQEALKEVTVPTQLFVAKDGVEAWEMLQHKGEHAKTPLPDLILLDLNLPRMGGLELLKRLKEDPAPSTNPP
ncbi:MAG: hypothetical protein KatS3mg115_0802 [Candidatus Poribacteria bacterium]|nr:MAG: hypothetical protein KatS3mg115_0802 [Candidatus Poribacteria bacterium]